VTRPARPGQPGWRPRLVALDIDGTLLRWVEEVDTPHELVERRVVDAVRRAEAAGAHVVLSSGRAPHGMIGVADLIGLTGHDGEPLWVVGSNGAVLTRYVPGSAASGGEPEVVSEETFDAAPAVRAILEQRPTARVAVEERGVGYRVTQPFPDGELTGTISTVDVEDLVAEPVSRVIVRDPSATADDFVELGASLGLHGTDYVVGWTAWLDLTPVGVSKASGLEHVCEQLGLTSDDVLAIGDGRNDVEMLRWAGRGVAMGQAVEDVRAAADAVTGTVDDDGAALEIERWFPVPGPPREVRTGRLRLILLDGADADDMLAGRHQDRWHPDYPRPDDVDAASMVARGLGPDGAPEAWGPRHVVLDGLAVGTVGFFGPPSGGEVEVGYGLVEAARGRGVATEALQGLLALTDELGLVVRAAVEPGNTASVRVLAKAGFTGLRGSDEEGRLVMVRPVPGGAGRTGGATAAAPAGS